MLLIGNEQTYLVFGDHSHLVVIEEFEQFFGVILRLLLAFAHFLSLWLQQVDAVSVFKFLLGEPKSVLAEL